MQRIRRLFRYPSQRTSINSYCALYVLLLHNAYVILLRMAQSHQQTIHVVLFRAFDRTINLL